MGSLFESRGRGRAYFWQKHIQDEGDPLQVG